MHALSQTMEGKERKWGWKEGEELLQLWQSTWACGEFGGGKEKETVIIHSVHAGGETA